MILLVVFAFIAGIVTILSPCILPILPIVLAGSAAKGKQRPFGIVFGFVASFTFFTLFLSQIVRAFGIPSESLRNFSVAVIFLFGLSFFIPKFRVFLEQLFARLSSSTSGNKKREGFWGGVIVGISIGLLWTPCVGPILASVITLAISGEVTGSAFLITLAYALGTAIPMLAIIFGGQRLLQKNRWLLINSERIQKVFGLLMILTALGIFLNFDRKFQTYILEKFPNYGVGLTKFEDNEIVKRALDRLSGKGVSEKDMGKPSFDLSEDGLTAPELIEGGVWFNSDPLTIRSLRGKVVLVDFWTYTCINCIRTLPYLRNWHDKYAEKGLVIIGVHTPEFEFEKSAENVQKAIDDFELKYPIMQDNDFATWNAYNNRYWPAKYLIDKNGKIRYTHFGEGEYDETEEMIQKLLSETGVEVKESIDNPSYRISTKTPELYLGFGRMGYFATPDQLAEDEKKSYTLPKDLVLHHFALSGDWQIEEERSMPFEGSTLVLAFEAKDVFLVMRPKGDNKGVIKVYLDEKLLSGSSAGEDVKNGNVLIDVDRLYELVKIDRSGKHVLRIEFLDDNIELYAFTFG